MNPDPISFSFGLADFDLGQLPFDPAQLKANAELLESAVSDYYAEEFRKLGGEASISITHGTVTVQWVAKSGLTGLVEQATHLLQKGDYLVAVPMLQSALARAPRGRESTPRAAWTAGGSAPVAGQMGNTRPQRKAKIKDLRMDG